MISEEQQDQAALYVLGLLEPHEAAAFESELSANAELRDIARELREAAGNVALTVPPRTPPASLKQRIMREIAMKTEERTVVPQRRAPFGWVPWAMAAALAVFCGLLAVDRVRLQRQLADIRAVDPLMQTTFYTLAPSAPAPADAKATVAWQPGRQSGVIRISNLPAPQPGKDYQLWAVDAEHKDPISAGIVRVDKNGVAQIRFNPVEKAEHVKAFAISLEREGGVPKKEGPILLVGTT
ncbi:MAG TPA: anti-sigma factor [Candidatus Udaeobacter sp.]|jgi:anti-sigma-K factor RskA|nr:anti-sigma factor [Candidatus Udaeobacter sp.]